MYKITFASGNMHKVDEINVIAKDYDIEFVLPDGKFDPIEDGTNFLENAYCKAKCASEISDTELFLADDSGLCVEALNGEPGIRSARYAPTPKERINKLLDAMQNKDNRKAKFVCAMVICDKNGKIVFSVQKECLGSILKEEKGNGGFGYDPIFFVDERNCSMAELKKEEKAQVSHRSKALREVLAWISQNKL
ncbi:MAG: RdgB/HAM1 family non-canonical purine NTP pyrophosphatase [Candidatus Gastranaerophilales bacterium]|nr:RdgB/HAM1 family non-canonical purine NTP pyrophosphatase [Candidatus Gastranaerophilales bacterium]